MRCLCKNVVLLRTILICVSVVIGCTPAANPENEAQQVQSVRDNVFRAISDSDSASLSSQLSSDFILISSNGQLSNPEKLWNMVKGLKGMGMKLDFAFEDISTQVEGAVAWMTYRYREVITSESKNDTLHFIESSVFRRQQDKWRMVLAHYSNLAHE